MVTRVTTQFSRSLEGCGAHLRTKPKLSRPSLSRIMFLEELPAVFRVAEGLCASGPCGREGARHIASGETCGQVCAPHILMQEARVEAISCSHCVHGFDLERCTHEALRAALRHRTRAAELYHDQGHKLRQFLHRRFQIADSG